MARKGAKAKITAKQRAARKRNIKIAQASKKRGVKKGHKGTGKGTSLDVSRSRQRNKARIARSIRSQEKKASKKKRTHISKVSMDKVKRNWAAMGM